ncbi:MAG: lytic transglycosylase domain-containing protein [Bacteroidales bacterium]|nr:lytic transglycosylase domain-containing protein [Bacteroidales bacterium]
MKKLLAALVGLVGVVVAIVLFTYSSETEKNPDKQYRKAFERNYKIFSPKIPKSLSFAGEAVPIDTFYVRESLDRELSVNTYFHSSTLSLFKRAYRWFPVIEPILEKNNIPNDFKYLALIESGFLNVESPAGAAGFWQFLKPTAKELGLEVTRTVDERYHLEKATKAACEYFRKKYEHFGTWTLTAAAYNAGKRRINDYMDYQMAGSYYDLYMNEETSRYVYRILALKTIMEDPKEYGFYLRQKDLYPPIPTKKLPVDTGVSNLPAFAKKFGTNYRILKELNPWLRDKKLTNVTRKDYVIEIPVKDSVTYHNLIEQINKKHHIFNEAIHVDQID